MPVMPKLKRNNLPAKPIAVSVSRGRAVLTERSPAVRKVRAPTSRVVADVGACYYRLSSKAKEGRDKKRGSSHE